MRYSKTEYHQANATMVEVGDDTVDKWFWLPATKECHKEKWYKKPRKSSPFLGTLCAEIKNEPRVNDSGWGNSQISDDMELGYILSYLRSLLLFAWRLTGHQDLRSCSLPFHRLSLRSILYFFPSQLPGLLWDAMRGQCEWSPCILNNPPRTSLELRDLEAA